MLMARYPWQAHQQMAEPGTNPSAPHTLVIHAQLFLAAGVIGIQPDCDCAAGDRIFCMF